MTEREALLEARASQPDDAAHEPDGCLDCGGSPRTGEGYGREEGE